MRTVLSISLAFALILACGNGAGQGIAAMGANDCGVWVKARKENLASLLEAHLIGFLDGMAAGRATEIWEAQGVKMSAEQAYLWMDKYCQSNPLSHVITGAHSLANERTNGAFGRRAKVLQ